MSVKMPGWLLVTLLGSGSVLLGMGLYLEFWQIEVLQAHPIVVNLLSGAIGFCFGIPAISGVIGQVLARKQREAESHAYAMAVAKLISTTGPLMHRLTETDVYWKARIAEIWRSLENAMIVDLDRSKATMPRKRLAYVLNVHGRSLAEGVATADALAPWTLYTVRILLAALDRLAAEHTTAACTKALNALTVLIDDLKESLNKDDEPDPETADDLASDSR